MSLCEIIYVFLFLIYIYHSFVYVNLLYEDIETICSPCMYFSARLHLCVLPYESLHIMLLYEVYKKSEE